MVGSDFVVGMFVGSAITGMLWLIVIGGFLRAVVGMARAAKRADAERHERLRKAIEESLQTETK